MGTIVEQLADFAGNCIYENLPPDVIAESKRTILDSIGCALAGLEDKKGRIGVEYGRMLGTAPQSATVIGTGEQLSVTGAAFANSELINALDFDLILPPGHVTPYVLPVALAVAESIGANGRNMIVASAIAHEMSFRMGKGMDYLRDTQDGKVNPPPVFGYSSTIFGATAAAGYLRGLSPEVIASGLGIAAAISPVNAHWPWFKHVPTSTIKYVLGGQICQSALTAVAMAELGHRGDLQMLDDREFGYARIIGTSRWEPEKILDGLGEQWNFPASLGYKPYPHCRILHAPLEAMTRVLDEQSISVGEIDAIKVWVEGFVEQPAWLNRDIKMVHDAQFSIAHGIALGAHRIAPGKAWQDPQSVFDPSVVRLMDKVTYEIHPDYVKLRAGNAAAQPARVEITARGKTFVGEQNYPKGVRSPEIGTYMTDDELVAKFLRNAQGVLSPAMAEKVAAEVMNMEESDDVSRIMRQLGPESRPDGHRDSSPRRNVA